MREPVRLLPPVPAPAVVPREDAAVEEDAVDAGRGGSEPALDAGDPGLYGGRAEGLDGHAFLPLSVVVVCERLAPDSSAVRWSAASRASRSASAARASSRSSAARRIAVSLQARAGHLAGTGGLPRRAVGQAHHPGERVTLTSGAEEGGRGHRRRHPEGRHRGARGGLGAGGGGVLLVRPLQPGARTALGPGRLGEPAAAGLLLDPADPQQRVQPCGPGAHADTASACRAAQLAAGSATSSMPCRRKPSIASLWARARSTSGLEPGT